MNNDVRVFDQGSGDISIRNVAFDEPVARIVEDALQVFEPSGISQFIEGRHLPVRMGTQGVADEVRPNKAGTAGDENFNHQYVTTRCLSCPLRGTPRPHQARAYARRNSSELREPRRRRITGPAALRKRRTDSKMFPRPRA